MASQPEVAPLSGLLKKAQEIEPWLISVRRELHQYPELLFDEHNTSKTIRRYLDDLKIPYKFPMAKTGIVATIGKGNPIVALRADIDALPIHEQNDISFKSTKEGVMHACGHDAHITMLLGGAKLLKEREADLKGTVRLIFQPAEEGGSGGDLMVKEGAVDGVGAIFGFHVWPMLPSGVVATRAGEIMAGAMSFDVVIKGRGGHAAMPHLLTDPIVAVAATISALQVLVSRETSPLDSGVVSVTRVVAGEGAYNVIPDSASFGGTIRALSHDVIILLKRRVEEVVKGQAASYGCVGEIDWMENELPYYPPTVNDPATAKFTKDVATRLLGDASLVQEAEPSLAGEDFSFYGSAVPAAFTFLGIRNEAKGSVHGLHTARFTLDEDVLKLGAALHTALAVDFLNSHQKGQAKTEL